MPAYDVENKYILHEQLAVVRPVAGWAPRFSSTNGFRYAPTVPQELAPPTREDIKKVNNIRKLNSFQDLAENWNGYGAPAFQDEVLEKVRNILEFIPIQPDVFPTGRGSIQLEYENEANYLEFEIYPDRISVYQEKDGQEVEREIEPNQIRELVDEFHAG